jgi:hypothetical protein
VLDLNYQRLIIAYHGCDARVATRVLAGNGTLSSSENNYDWLGRGIYFWEQGPQRAYDWAVELSRRETRKVRTPAVIGAYINLGQCFDLLDTANTEMLGRMYWQFRQTLREQRVRMPKNETVPGGRGRDKLLRYLDCAVINWSLDRLAQAHSEYQTVRGVFIEGRPAYPGAQIRLKNHIQVAVRKAECIIGFFRPNPLSYASAGSTQLNV